MLYKSTTVRERVRYMCRLFAKERYMCRLFAKERYMCRLFAKECKQLDSEKPGRRYDGDLGLQF